MHQKDKTTSISWNSRGVRLERIPRLRGYKIFVQPNSTILLKIPSGWSDTKILETLGSHRDWIEKCLQKAIEIQSQFHPYMLVEGEKYLLLGEFYCLRFEPAEQKKYSIVVKGQTLVVQVPQKFWREGFSSFPHPGLKKYLMQFYNTQAERLLVPLFWKSVRTVGYGPKHLSLRNQKTLWGSCSRHRSAIQINKKLIAAPLFVSEYVMIHELAHLKFSNHGAGFWAEVEKNCPNYKQAEEWLSKNHYLFSFFENNQDLFSSYL